MQQNTEQQNTAQDQKVSYEEQMTWRSRMFLIRTVPILYVVSLIVSIAFYWITKDWHYFLLASPTLLFPAVFRLVPMDERRYNLKMAKIEASKQMKILDERVKKLEKAVNGRKIQ